MLSSCRWVIIATSVPLANFGGCDEPGFLGNKSGQSVCLSLTSAADLIDLVSRDPLTLTTEVYYNTPEVERREAERLEGKAALTARAI